MAYFNSDRKRKRDLLKKRTAANKINRNFRYDKSGAQSKIEIPNLKIKTNLVHIAKLARMRKPDELPLDADDAADIRERKKENRKYKELKASKLRAARGEFVLLNGDNYTGYYHVHEGDVIMTEATHLEERSQPLIPKTEYLDNKPIYDTMSKNLEYENPYRRKNDLREMNKKARKNLVPTKKVGWNTGGGGSGGGGY
jgi:hypothetical protein